MHSLVNGPVNIRSSLSSLSAIRVGDDWSYQNNLLTLGQYCCCDSDGASLWNAPVKISLSRAPAFANCIKVVESALLESGIIRNSVAGVTHSLTMQRLDSYQSLLSDSLLSTEATEQYAVPAELIGLIGCGEGLTPAGDDVLVGVLIAAIHFDLTHLSDPLISWLKLYSQVRTNQISHTHLLAACEGQSIEPLHILLNTLASDSNNLSSTTNSTSKNSLEQAITTLMNHGHSSGYYTLTGVLLVLKTLAGSMTETC